MSPGQPNDQPSGPASRSRARIKARGIEIAYGPYPARDGQRANVLIRDNAGNLIQLFGS